MLPGAQPHLAAATASLRSFFERQQEELQGARALDQRRWNKILTPILAENGRRTAQAYGSRVARRFGVTFDADEIMDWLVTVAAITAKHTNRTTAENIDIAMRDMPRSEAIEKVFQVAITSRAHQIARSKFTTTANVGRQVAAEQGGAGSKIWIVTSGKPRSTHASMNGQAVKIGAVFSNGAKWPGDPNLSVDERANCACFCDFGG